MTFFSKYQLNIEDFNFAKSFFDKNPALVKLKKNPQKGLKNSFIIINNELYAIGSGEKAYLGRGAFAHVKEVADSKGNLYVIKIQDNIHLVNSNEEKISKEIGLLLGSALCKNHKNILKNYFLMPHLGKDLFTCLVERNFTKVDRIILSILVIQAILKMHEQKYIHGDFKPENIALKSDSSLTINTKIIDLGFAKKLEEENILNPPELIGTKLFLPIRNMDFIQKDELAKDLKQLGYMGKDIFALKRVLYLDQTIDISLASCDEEKSSLLGKQLYSELPTKLKEILDTSTIENGRLKAISRYKDTASYLATCFVWCANNLHTLPNEKEFDYFEEQIRENKLLQKNLISEFKLNLDTFFENYRFLIEGIIQDNYSTIEKSLSQYPTLLNYSIPEGKTPFQQFVEKINTVAPHLQIEINFSNFVQQIENKRKILNLFLMHFSFSPFPLNEFDNKALHLILLILSFDEKNQALVEKIFNNKQLELHSLSIPKKDKIIGLCLNFLPQEHKTKMQEYIAKHTNATEEISLSLKDFSDQLPSADRNQFRFFTQENEHNSTKEYSPIFKIFNLKSL